MRPLASDGRQTVGRAVVNALAEAGAGEIFGIPGDFALPLFDEIMASGRLPLFTLSHEPSVAFAADAAARVRGGIGVAAVTFGAGALNCVNAIAGAYAERSRVVVLSGGPGAAERAGGLLVHHQARSLGSQLEVYREITCDQAVLTDPEGVPSQVARVLRSCREHSQPVYIEIARDVARAPCSAIPVAPASFVDMGAVEAAADELLARIRAALAPLLLVGVEVQRYGLEAEVADLCARLNVDVATTFMGRGLMADRRTQLVGTYLGVAGDPTVTHRVEAADELVMLGVLLSDTNFGVSGRRIDLRRATIAVERTVRAGYRQYPGVPLRELVAVLNDRVRSRPVASAVVATPPATPPPVADDASITPSDVAVAVTELFERHGRQPIASDMGDCLFTALEMAYAPLVAPGYYATMGFGIPAGLGVQASTGERPLIVVGDGAFQMTGLELGHCARYGWDPIVLVFNNASWGMLREFVPQATYTQLGAWRYADLANALGGDGVRVTTFGELVGALDAARRRRGRFQLIEVVLAEGSVSPTLARYVAALKASRPVLDGVRAAS